MKEDILMKCRSCKKKYKSDEWKRTGNLNGLCSSKCRKERNKRCIPCNLFPNLTKELNKITIKENE